MAAFDYLWLAESFDSYFTQPHFIVSRTDGLRVRYQCEMSQIDYWINLQHLDVTNAFSKDAQKVKNGMFYHLRKMGWRPTIIKGRWKKEVWI